MLKKSLGLLLSIVLLCSALTAAFLNANAADGEESENTLTVLATSNFFPEAMETYENGIETITVSYMLQLESPLLNSEWYLYYNPEILNPTAELNINEAGDGYSFMPQVGRRGSLFNLNSSTNTIAGNCSSLELYDFSSLSVFVQVTFEVVGMGDTVVRLYVKGLRTGDLNTETNQLLDGSEVSYVSLGVINEDVSPVCAKTVLTESNIVASSSTGTASESVSESVSSSAAVSESESSEASAAYSEETTSASDNSDSVASSETVSATEPAAEITEAVTAQEVNSPSAEASYQPSSSSAEASSNAEITEPTELSSEAVTGSLPEASSSAEPEESTDFAKTDDFTYSTEADETESVYSSENANIEENTSSYETAEATSEEITEKTTSKSDYTEGSAEAESSGSAVGTASAESRAAESTAGSALSAELASPETDGSAKISAFANAETAGTEALPQSSADSAVSSADNSAVQTGCDALSLNILLILISLVSLACFYRKYFLSK